jgi:alpha-tubulin suppressor-like RCC1 family protein
VQLVDVGQIAAGSVHTCVIQDNGDLYCFGSNRHKQLGSSLLTQSYVPLKLFVGSAVSRVCVGDDHTCIVTNGAAKCVGKGGLLGTSSATTDTSAMVQVLNAVNIRDVTCAVDHSCVISNSGVVSCFGSFINGQMANGQTTGASLPPVEITGGYNGVLDVSAGRHFTCIVTNAGAVMCSGENESGQLGALGVSRSVMTHTTLNSGIAKVSCGYNHACALSIDTVVYCWGSSEFGQTGTTSGSFATLGVAVTLIATGNGFTCGLFSGVVQCFGFNVNGQLARGTTDANVNNIPSDTLFTGTCLNCGRRLSSTTIADIACGESYTCVRLVSGEVQCVGGLNTSYFGQLGNGLPMASLGVVSAQGLPATLNPSISPSMKPTLRPTAKPTFPTTRSPSQRPTKRPSVSPTFPTTGMPTGRKKTSTGKVPELAVSCILFLIAAVW